MKTLTLIATMLALCATCVAAEKATVTLEGRLTDDDLIRFGEGLTYVELSPAEIAGLITPAYAAEKKATPKPTPTAAAAKERQARQRLAMDFRRVVDKLSADEVAAVKAVVAKHQTAKPAAKPAAPAKKK